MCPSRIGKLECSKGEVLHGCCNVYILLAKAAALNVCFPCTENENWFSARLPHVGARKKYKAHISKYVRHILKYKAHIFRPLKTRLKTGGAESGVFMVQNEKSRTVRVAAVPAFCVSRQRGQFFAPKVTLKPRLMFMLPLLTGMPCGVILLSVWSIPRKKLKPLGWKSSSQPNDEPNVEMA